MLTRNFNSYRIIAAAAAAAAPDSSKFALNQ